MVPNKQKQSEIQRLIDQGKLWRETAIELFESIGLRDHWKCVEIGSGPVGVMDVIDQILNKHGLIIAVDKELKYLGFAQQQKYISKVYFIGCDANSLALTKNYFDLVHARFCLSLLMEPETALQEMISITKKGGIIAIQDMDWSSMRYYPPYDKWYKIEDTILKLYDTVGNLNIGRHLKRMFYEAGIINIQEKTQNIEIDRKCEYFRFPLTGIKIMSDSIISKGISTKDELRNLTSDFESYLNKGGTRLTSFNLVQVWGKKL